MNLASRRSSDSPAEIIIKHVRAACDGIGRELPSVERARHAVPLLTQSGDVRDIFSEILPRRWFLLVRREELFEGGFV
jgi:hypothetical protein